MASEKHSEASRKNIQKVNSLGLNKHYGKDNTKWNGGNRLVGENPCPICGKSLQREKRYASLKCRECADKFRKPRGFHKGNKVRGTYYWEARKIIERSGIKLTSENHVHHKNGNWKDNRIENLIVTTKYEHRKKYHNSQNPDFNGFN